MTEAGDLEKTPEEAQDSALPDAPPKGMSPYATGGGGVTFERKVAVTYLAHLLVGDGAAEQDAEALARHERAAGRPGGVPRDSRG